MNDIQRLRQTELAQLRAANPVPTGAPAQAKVAHAVASAGVSERKRADILAKIDAIEAQMRAEWAAPAPGAPVKP
jgi:hypothetical protein